MSQKNKLNKPVIRKWSEIVTAIHNAPLCLCIPNGIVKIIVDKCFDMHWDESMSFGIKLHENKCILSHSDSDGIMVNSPCGWQTTRGNICLDDINGYIYEWDIEATNFHEDYGDIIIGILSDDGLRPSDNCAEHDLQGFVDKCEIWAYHSTNNMNCGGYSAHQFCSRDFGGSVQHDKELNESFGIGDIITTIYNSKLKTLQFKKNGKYIYIENVNKDKSDKNKNNTVIYTGINGNIFPFVTVYSFKAKAKLIDVRYYKFISKSS
eukprot:44100_1